MLEKKNIVKIEGKRIPRGTRDELSRRDEFKRSTGMEYQRA